MTEAQPVEKKYQIPKSGQARGRRVFWLVLGILAGLILVSVGLYMLMSASMGSVPEGLDTTETRATDNGLYRVSYASESGTFALNKIHSWILHVETADGKPLENAVISVDGGMPQHGHGLPTQPQVTQYLGNGDYLVEGMKFQMAGWWEVKFEIAAGNLQDRVTFNLVME